MLISEANGAHALLRHKMVDGIEYVMNERLEKIEGKITLTEDLLDELNKLVYKQQQQIEQLQRAVVRLQEQMESAPLNERRSLMDEIPPHY